MKSKYNIGDTIKDENRDFTIIDKNVIGEKYKTRKYYKYYCNLCGYDCSSGFKGGISLSELWITSYQITRGDRCSCCSGKTTVTGINSIGDIRPDLIKYFNNKSDAFKYSLKSNKKVKFRCPNCTYTKTMVVSDFIINGFTCLKCSDKISLGEKIVYLLLTSLNIHFTKEFIFSKDLDNHRYDFYLNNLNTIIEVHGKQHYDGSFQSYEGGRTLKEEQENDEFKCNYAVEQGIKHYIIIDAKESNFDYIKKSICESKLNEIVDLHSVDWDFIKIDVFSHNIIKDICNYWNDNKKCTYEDIQNKFGFSIDTIRKYLKIGDDLGWCVYSGVMNTTHYNNTFAYDAPDRTRPIKCIEKNIYFKGCKLCSKMSYQIFGRNIGASTIRYMVNNIKAKSRCMKCTFEYVSKKEFNKAIKDGLQCYGSPFLIEDER